MNSITIFSARVARDLILKDFKLMDIKPDREKRIKTIFYFSDTEDLRIYLSKEHNIEIN